MRFSWQHLLILFLLTSGSMLHAQNITIRSDKSDYQIYDEVVISLDGELSDFTQYATLPAIYGLTLSGVDQNFDNSAPGNKVRIHQTFRYIANQSGDYEIGPAVIYSGTKRYFSNTISMHVAQDARFEAEGLAFIKTEISGKTFFLGERIPVYTRLYYRNDYSVETSSVFATDYKGFWHPDVTTYFSYNGKPDSIVIIRGKSYFTRLIAVDYLYPNAVGKLKIPEYSTSLTLTEKSDDYDSYSTSVDVNSLGSEINVIDLPARDSLPGYNGDVGELDFRVLLNDTITEEWNPVRLKVILSGKTNFSMMIPPALSLPHGMRLEFIKSYDSLSFTDIESAWKIFEYQLIAEKQGDYDLDGLAYSYFNTKKREYITLYGDTIHLHVTPGTKIDADSESNLPDTFLSAKSTLPRLLLVVMACIAGASLLVFFILRYRKTKAANQAEALKAAEVRKETEYTVPIDTTDQQAVAMINSAGLMLRNGQCAQSVDTAYQALIIRICGVTKLKPQEVSAQNLRYKLKNKITDTAALEALVLHIDELKLRRYSLKGSEFELAAGLIDRTRNMLDLLR
jgi:uncharacterized protein (DUF433 family)